MSDLAPFVCAVLRDKVLADIKDEHRQLLDAHLRAQRYEIRHMEKDDDDEAFCQTNLQDAKVSKDGRYLFLPLNTTKPCPLAMLRDLHVCVGGHHKVALEQLINQDETLQNRRDDTETCKTFLVHGSSRTLLQFKIEGWPRSDYQECFVNHHTSMDLLDHLVERVAIRYPQATVTFQALITPASLERAAINQLPEPARTRLQTQIAQAVKANLE